jgi:hypothetical protein
MAHNVFYYGNEFKRFSDEFEAEQKTAKDKSTMQPHIAAAIHVFSIYQNKHIAHHKKVAGIFSDFLALFNGVDDRLPEALIKDTDACKVFTNIVAETQGIHLRGEEKIDDATNQKVIAKTQEQMHQPSVEVRNKFLAFMMSRIINNIKLAETKSDFASVCQVVAKNLNLQLEVGAQAKLLMSNNYAQGCCCTFWSADKLRQQDIDQFEQKTNTKVRPVVLKK